VNLVDAEEQEMIGRECICEEIGAEMKELIGNEEGSNRKDTVIQKKEEKFPKYTTMGFNRKEVETVFTGQ